MVDVNSRHGGSPPLMFREVRKGLGRVAVGPTRFSNKLRPNRNPGARWFRLLVIRKVSLARERCLFKKYRFEGAAGDTVMYYVCHKTHGPTVPRCGRTREEL